MRIFARDNGKFAILVDDDMTEVLASKGLLNVLCFDPTGLITDEELVAYDGDPDSIEWDQKAEVSDAE